MLTYLNGPESDPFNYIYASKGWLSDYDPPRPFPFWINLEPTNHCQLNCLFCSRQKSQRAKGYLDLALAEALFDEVAAQNALRLPEVSATAVRFTGWGEPLLHPHIDKLCALAKKRSIPLKLYTNGLNLSPALMDQLIELEVDDLQFSMQGLNEKQYLFNRVGSDYRLLVHNIETISQKRGRLKKPFLSILTSVLASELKSARPDEFTERFLGLVDKVAIDLTNLNFVSDLERVKPHLGDQSKGLRRGLCVDVFLALEVKYDGTIGFCGQDADSLKEHTAGRFPQDRLKEAWLGRAMEAQRDKVGRNLGHDDSPVCRRCYHNTDKYDLFKQNGAKNGGSR
ncbi:MAG: radical SAM protein [Deltaproteobacteria bacterium]|nr:radical SAM protein [Deltaproteobacteria bacterium]